MIRITIGTKCSWKKRGDTNVQKHTHGEDHIQILSLQAFSILRAVETVVPFDTHREVEEGGVRSFVTIVAASPSDIMVNNRCRLTGHYS